MTAVGVAIPAWLDRLQRLDRQSALALVRPPLTPHGIRDALAAEGLAVPAPVEDWYAAWDGQQASGALGDMDALPGFYALSLGDALAHRRAERSWQPEWLPLLADGGGDFYMADTSSPASRVLRHRYEYPGAEPVAASLEAFLDAVLHAFDHGIIFVKDGYLDQDEDAWREALGTAG